MPSVERIKSWLQEDVHFPRLPKLADEHKHPQELSFREIIAYDKRVRESGTKEERAALAARQHHFNVYFGLTFGLFAILGFFIAKQQTSSHDAAKAYFAYQVVRCYNMNDLALLANQSLCQDSMKRFRGY